MCLFVFVMGLWFFVCACKCLWVDGGSLSANQRTSEARDRSIRIIQGEKLINLVSRDLAILSSQVENLQNTGIIHCLRILFF